MSQVISDIEGAMSLEQAQELAGEIAQLTTEKLEIVQYHGHRHVYGELKATDPYRVLIHVPHPVHRFVYKPCNSREQWEHYWKGEYLQAAIEAAAPKQGGLL